MFTRGADGEVHESDMADSVTPEKPPANYVAIMKTRFHFDGLSTRAVAELARNPEVLRYFRTQQRNKKKPSDKQLRSLAASYYFNDDVWTVVFAPEPIKHVVSAALRL